MFPSIGASHATGDAVERLPVRICLRLLLCLACAIPAFAQPFTFGAKVGVPLTDLVDTVQSPRFGFNSETKRYIVGGTAELRLPFGLGVEFDALYRRLNIEGNGTLLDVITNNKATGNAWEFPLLAKYRFKSHIVRPYVSAGVAWESLSGLTQAIARAGETGLVADKTTTGFVMGAGFEFRALLIRLSPEIRYTRWGSSHFQEGTGLSTNRNQAEFLLGITF